MRNNVAITMLIHCSHNAKCALCIHVLIAYRSTLLLQFDCLPNSATVNSDWLHSSVNLHNKRRFNVLFQTQWWWALLSEKNDIAVRMTDRKEKSMCCISSIAFFPTLQMLMSEEPAIHHRRLTQIQYLRIVYEASNCQKGQSRDFIRRLIIINCQICTANSIFFPCTRREYSISCTSHHPFVIVDDKNEHVKWQVFWLLAESTVSMTFITRFISASYSYECE